MSPQLNVCNNEDCSFAADGKCVEGYSLNECPHLQTIGIDDFDAVNEPEIVSKGPSVLVLDLGETLNRSQASLVQTRRVSRVIGIIGPNDAGKTSLLASIYDLLQEGPVAGVGFAGSSTLVGFEKVCHDARFSSRRSSPHTERTTQGSEATFFHLDLQPTNGTILSLLISDRSGEDYLAACDDLSTAAEFFEVRRADAIALLVNGEHLADSEHRHEVTAITTQIVDALVEARSLRKGSSLAVVLTKHDSVLASPHSERVQQEFAGVVDSIIANYGSYFRKIDRFAVAASPKDLTRVKRGEGVDRLLEFWLSVVSEPAPVVVEGSKSTRMIDLFGNVVGGPELA